jgi:hypothetical protein
VQQPKRHTQELRQTTRLDASDPPYGKRLDVRGQLQQVLLAYLERGNNLALWHRVVPSLFTLDDHEILDNVFGSGTAGF